MRWPDATEDVPTTEARVKVHRVLLWALLVVGSVASLAANVAVAKLSLAGQVIAARPSR
jgi:hypothetical protein